MTPLDKSAPPTCIVLADVSTVYSLGEADSFIVEAVYVSFTLSNNATTSVPLNVSKLPE